MAHHDHAQSGDGHQHGYGGDDAALAELVDLDAEVLSGYLDDVMGLLVAAVDGPVRRIIDLGCGTGTGALALLRRFDGAEVIAVDASPAMLERVRAKALDLGLREAIRTVRADLDDSWPVLGPVDLVWASASMHHLADPDRIIAEVFGALRPGGRFVVAELDSFPRFLPEGLGDGLEERLHRLLDEARAHHLPYLGDDWATRLRRAGFAIEQERTFTIDLTAPLPPATGRYAHASLRRARSSLNGRIGVADLATLDALVDGDGPQSVLRRDDLRVRATRTLSLARRP